MTEEIPMPVAEVNPLTADEWADLWRKESDARNALWKEHQKAKDEIERLNKLLDASTVHSCGDHCQRPTCRKAMRNAIKDAHWQLFAFLKPGDEKTKEIIERLQKFL